MRKISLVAAIALMLAGVGPWATSTTQARIDPPAGAQINPLQITMGAGHLRVAHYDDYSPATFKVMERRSLNAIINPAMVTAWIVGLWLAVGLYWILVFN